METSKNFPGAEGCSSSESGWTMYIASPLQEDDVECSEENEDDNHQDPNDGEDDGDAGNSDDSMASDASSGPSNHHHEYKNDHGQGSRSNSQLKHDKGNRVNNNKHSLRKEATKEEKKGVGNNTKDKRRISGWEKYRR